MEETSNTSPVPKSAGEALAEPPVLSDPQIDLCQRLDSFYARYKDLKMKPSVMFQGALFASKGAFRNGSNPDWISQAANSLREILFPFRSTHKKAGGGFREALKETGSIYADDDAFEERVIELYEKVNDLAHHGVEPRRIMDFAAFTAADFDALLTDFEKTMIEALTLQIDVHTDLKDVITGGPPT